MKKHFKFLVGIALIALGVFALNLNSVDYYGQKTERTAYGGDAYTGIQNAAADTANNINKLGNTIAESHSKQMTFVGTSMIVFGALTIVYDLLGNNKKKSETEEKK